MEVCLSSEASPEDRGQTLAQDTDRGAEVEMIVIILGNIIDTYTCWAIYSHHYAQPSKRASGVDAAAEWLYEPPHAVGAILPWTMMDAP